MDFRLRSSLLRCPQRRLQRNFRCSIVFIWSSHSIGAIKSQGSLRGDSTQLATPFTIHLYYQQTTHSSNIRLILNLDYRSEPGHPRLRPPLLPAVQPFLPSSHSHTYKPWLHAIGSWRKWRWGEGGPTISSSRIPRRLLIHRIPFLMWWCIPLFCLTTLLSPTNTQLL